LKMAYEPTMAEWYELRRAAMRYRDIVLDGDYSRNTCVVVEAEFRDAIEACEGKEPYNAGR